MHVFHHLLDVSTVVWQRQHVVVGITDANFCQAVYGSCPSMNTRAIKAEYGLVVIRVVQQPLELRAVECSGSLVLDLPHVLDKLCGGAGLGDGASKGLHAKAQEFGAV